MSRRWPNRTATRLQGPANGASGPQRSNWPPAAPRDDDSHKPGALGPGTPASGDGGHWKPASGQPKRRGQARARAPWAWTSPNSGLLAGPGWGSRGVPAASGNALSRASTSWLFRAWAMRSMERSRSNGKRGLNRPPLWGGGAGRAGGPGALAAEHAARARRSGSKAVHLPTAARKIVISPVRPHPSPQPLQSAGSLNTGVSPEVDKE